MTPILIALCGAPGAGKSEVQRILEDEHGYESVDDGAALRAFCSVGMGVSMFDTRSQNGKAKLIRVGARKKPLRWWLGEVGKAVEAHFGEDFIPQMAIQSALRDWVLRGEDGARPTGYTFGSVRRSQGRVYRAEAGCVVEVIRPGTSVINDFDQYDRRWVTHVIENDGSLEDLRTKVCGLVYQISESLQNAA